MSKAKWNQARGVWSRKIDPLRKQGFIEVPPDNPTLTAQAAAEGVNLIAKRNEIYVFLEAWAPGDEGYEAEVRMVQWSPDRYTVYVSPRSKFYTEARRLNEEHRRAREDVKAAEEAEKARLTAEAEQFAQELLQFLPGWSLEHIHAPESPECTRVFLRTPDGREATTLMRYKRSTPQAVAERLLKAYAMATPSTSTVFA